VVPAQVHRDAQQPGPERKVARAAAPGEAPPCRLEGLEEGALGEVPPVLRAASVAAHDGEHRRLVAAEELSEDRLVARQEGAEKLVVGARPAGRSPLEGKHPGPASAAVDWIGHSPRDGHSL
jgi:hypothetical protein